MMIYPSLVKCLEDIGNDSWKRDIIRGIQEITCSHTFGVICATFKHKGRGPTNGSEKYERLIVSIRRSSLYEFWSRKPEREEGT